MTDDKNTAKDALGQGLSVGDRVAWGVKSGIRHGTVTSIGPEDAWGRRMLKSKGDAGILGTGRISTSFIRLTGDNEVVIAKTALTQLEDDSDKLDCLKACGVDNWQGYDDAMEMYREDRKEEE